MSGRGLSSFADEVECSFQPRVNRRRPKRSSAGKKRGEGDADARDDEAEQGVDKSVVAGSRMYQQAVDQQRRLKAKIDQAKERQEQLAGEWFNPYHTSTFSPSEDRDLKRVNLTHDGETLTYPEETALGKALDRLGVNGSE